MESFFFFTKWLKEEHVAFVPLFHPVVQSIHTSLVATFKKNHGEKNGHSACDLTQLMFEA